MDSSLAPPIADALHDAIARSDTGYASHGDELVDAFADFANRRWQWTGRAHRRHPRLERTHTRTTRPGDHGRAEYAQADHSAALEYTHSGRVPHLTLHGLDTWPSTQLGEGTEGDLHYYVLPRRSGRARLYLLHDLKQKGRFAGETRTEKFLNEFRFHCMPDVCDFTQARPAGKCASYPLNDSWVDEPYAEGVVLIGDAAGWNDPIIGQGLSIALRDARMVREALSKNAGKSRDLSTLFRQYGLERHERMRRLRVTAHIKTSLVATFTDAGTARRRTYNAVWESDPRLAGPQLAPLIGPHNVDPAMFTDGAVEAILSLA